MQAVICVVIRIFEYPVWHSDYSLFICTSL